ncbi:MAG TPA: hypothetical protein V6C88_01800, partial [Chroococcidiopsis sp.]
VTLFSANYLEDESYVPDEFQRTAYLTRSILDLKSFQRPRKLALIKDICDRLCAVSDAEYLIYSNSNIAVMPHFYLAIARIIEQGYDAFVINRRTISKTFKRLRDIPFMYSEIGKPHSGHDCFIFRRDAYANYDFGSACIGVPKIGKIIFLNLIFNAQKFHEFSDIHLTFHLGNDRYWKSPELIDYFEHNEAELIRIFKQYAEQHPLPDHPHIKKLGDRYLHP